ncbi:MAG: hypothetical protein WC222_01370 [Parachlamydiales bacterium]|jgi:hypothetical protein
MTVESISTFFSQILQQNPDEERPSLLDPTNEIIQRLTDDDYAIIINKVKGLYQSSP